MPQFDTQFFSSLIFWECVSFGLLILVLYKFAFPQILATLDARARNIRENLEQADANRRETELRLRDYDAKLANAAQEADAIVAEAKATARRMLEENDRRLRADSERVQAETAREIERKQRKAREELQGEAADLALLVAEKVLERSLSDDDHRRLAQNAVQAIAADDTIK